MKLIVEETINNISEVEVLQTILQIADFDVGLRQMLEAEQSNTVTATDNITLTDSDDVIQVIDPGGTSRNVVLPAESIDNHGFLIFNSADVDTELLTVKDDAGNTIGVVYPNIKAGWFISNGVTWYSAGGSGSELNDLSDVDTTGIADEDFLQYDSGDMQFKPVAGGPAGAFTLWMDECVPSMGANFSTLLSTSQKYCIYSNTSAANSADGDYFTWEFTARKGTYSIKTLGVTSVEMAKVDYYIDDVLVSSGQDWYSGSAVFNVLKTITGITISTTGRHTLKILVNGKNASSADYSVYLTKIWGWRTGD